MLANRSSILIVIFALDAKRKFPQPLRGEVGTPRREPLLDGRPLQKPRPSGRGSSQIINIGTTILVVYCQVPPTSSNVFIQSGLVVVAGDVACHATRSYLVSERDCGALSRLPSLGAGPLSSCRSQGSLNYLGES